jgi:hypothetical protein
VRRPDARRRASRSPMQKSARPDLGRPAKIGPVSAEPSLAELTEGRPHWRTLGPDTAVYEPPGAGAHVRVQPIAQPTRRERYIVTVIRNGRAAHALPAGTAGEAVRTAERLRLD